MTIETVETRFLALFDLFQLVEIAGLVLLMLAVTETLWDLVTGSRSSLRETGANTVIAIVNALLERTVFGLVFVVGLAVTEAFASTRLPMTWWSWVAAVLLADFLYYWMHRAEHRIRILWAYHSVHHSSPEFNLTTALRLAWIEGVFEWVFFAPMVLLGFDLVQTVGAIVIVVAYQGWIHTEKIGRLGPLEKILNTPSAHRVHHACNRQYLDKNYGGILIIWDRMFGTYEPEDEQPIYGITVPVGSSNPFWINIVEYVRIFRELGRVRSLKKAYRTLTFMGVDAADRTGTGDGLNGKEQSNG